MRFAGSALPAPASPADSRFRLVPALAFGPRRNLHFAIGHSRDFCFASIQHQVLAAAGTRQGARHVRGGRRQVADRRIGPHLRLRRDPRRSHPRQGPGADRTDRVLAAEARPHPAQPLHRREAGRRGGGRGRPGARPRRGGQAPQAHPGRGRRARLPDRFGLEGLPGHRLGLRHQAARRPAAGQPVARADLHAGRQGGVRHAR